MPNPAEVLPLLADAELPGNSAYDYNPRDTSADGEARSVDDRAELIWSKAQALLQRMLPRPSYETWVHPMRALLSEDGALLLAAPSESALTALDEQLRGQITDAVCKAADAPVDVRLIVQGGDRRAAPTPPPPSATSEDPPESGARSALHPRYTFDTFVVGNSNRLAHAAALAVAEMPGRAYNPLFIYGGVGLGKTHLMQAIGNLAQQRRPSLKVLYVAAETFTNDMINSVMDGKGYEFRLRYRTIDILLIDDVQFIAGKVGTQEEFFHTFEALYGAQKQIVISSDRPPREITTLESRLRSRFEWGLITDVQQPDFEMRVAILRKKAMAENLDVDPEALEFIANNIDSNIRELEGALVRFIAYCSVHHVPYSADYAPVSLHDLLAPEKLRKITIPMIQKHVAEYYNVDVSDFITKKRTRAISFPRQIAMYIARTITDSSLPMIGDEFGGRDHSTVMHACSKIEADISADPQLRRVVTGLIEKIRS